MPLKKIHRPDECRCPNCCHNEKELRWARHNRMVRITGRGNRYANEKPWPAYKERALRKKFPPLFGTRKRKSLAKFYRWKNSIWEARQWMKNIDWEAMRAETARLRSQSTTEAPPSEVKSDESSG